MDEIRLLAGLDIGNGYVKGLVRDIDAEQEATQVDMPSCVAKDTNPTNQKWQGERLNRGIEDIYNSIDVTFDTPAVQDTRHRLFGRRGLASGKAMEEFDVASIKAKAECDLSGVLVLGILAGKAVQSYYKQHGQVPSGTLKAVVEEIALALPINEYSHFRDMYRAKFYDNTHYVTLHDFEKPVRVEVDFLDVQVHPEGVSAQYAISDMIRRVGPAAVDAMLNDVRANGMELEGVTPEMICAASNIIGIDIGEGTVNFPVHTNGQYNVDASRTLAVGYGSVLDSTLKVLREECRVSFPSRKALTEFLQSKSPIHAKQHALVTEKLANEVDSLADRIETEMNAIMKSTGQIVEVIYVYGGGSTAMKDVLFPRLVQMVRGSSMTGDGYPVLCLDSSYARNMNRKGLYLASEMTYASHQGPVA